jgi:hypothetical protein
VDKRSNAFLDRGCETSDETLLPATGKMSFHQGVKEILFHACIKLELEMLDH